MLKLLGYPSKQIDVSNEIDELKEQYKDIKKKDKQLITNVISRVSRERIDYLRNSIVQIQRYIYKSKSDYGTRTQSDTSSTDSYDFDEFLNKYKNKFTNIRLKDKNNKNKVFKDWRAVKYGIVFQDLKNKVINISDDVKYLSIDDSSETEPVQRKLKNFRKIIIQQHRLALVKSFNRFKYQVAKKAAQKKDDDK